jgi:hypothetical protein
MRISSLYGIAPVSNLFFPPEAPVSTQTAASVTMPTLAIDRDDYYLASTSPSFLRQTTPLSSSLLQLFGPSPIHKLLLPKLPEETAEILLNFTLEHKIDKTWLYQTLSQGIELGRTPELSCVFDSEAMQDILSHPERYGKIKDLLDAMGARQDDLVSCLTFWQKLKYGPKLQTLSDELKKEEAFFDALAARYAQCAEIPIGNALTTITSFLLRPDSMDADAKKTFELFMEKLRSVVIKNKPRSKAI